MVTDQEILYEVIHGGRTDEACCQRLLDLALHRGAPDNVTLSCAADRNMMLIEGDDITMDQYIGKMLDNRYEILELIGTGGMAKVYKAQCHRLNRLVAVKILKNDLAQDAEFRRRFHDESQAVAMLSHPNIVSVYDVSAARLTWNISSWS